MVSRAGLDVMATRGILPFLESNPSPLIGSLVTLQADFYSTSYHSYVLTVHMAVGLVLGAGFTRFRF